jgi:hypothetical protein
MVTLVKYKSSAVLLDMTLKNYCSTRSVCVYIYIYIYL